jgi:hypothetical protein
MSKTETISKIVFLIFLSLKVVVMYCIPMLKKALTISYNTINIFLGVRTFGSLSESSEPEQHRVADPAPPQLHYAVPCDPCPNHYCTVQCTINIMSK